MPGTGPLFNIPFRLLTSQMPHARGLGRHPLRFLTSQMPLLINPLCFLTCEIP